MKTWLAVGAFVVSLASAVMAWDARVLARRQFETDKTLQMLASAYGEILAGQQEGQQLGQQEGRGSDRRRWGCIFVSALRAAEDEVRAGRPPLVVRDFIDQATALSLWDPVCATRLEGQGTAPAAAATALPSPVAAPVAVVDGPATGAPGPAPEIATIGQWHAVIASYNVTEFGCRQGREDVAHFAKGLAGQGFGGRRVIVVQTRISNSLAVTVDAGDDRDLAAEISTRVRAVARDATGRDSFVQGNRGWTQWSACRVAATIPG